MAAIALQSGVTALSVVESIEQDTHPAGVVLTAGNLVKLSSTGLWALAVAADTGTYLVIKSVAAGRPVTGIKKGVVDGFALSALAYGAKLYSHADSVPDTATSTGALILGEVISAHSNMTGTDADKLFRVEMP